MSNRSFSFLKRLKTQKTERSHLNGWRNSNKTPTSRIQPSSRSPAHRDLYQKIELGQRDNYYVKCVNHPLKKGLFEPKESLKQAYCQDCSIRMVKNNVRMMRVSEQSLYLRAIYEAEIDRLMSYEQEVKQLVGNYFEGQRQIIKLSILKAKQSKQKIISIPIFKHQCQNDHEIQTKLKQALGHVNMKKIQLSYRPLNLESNYKPKQIKENNLQFNYQSNSTVENHEKENNDFENRKFSFIDLHKKKTHKSKDVNRMISLR